jgi:hypothetical protein
MLWVHTFNIFAEDLNTLRGTLEHRLHTRLFKYGMVSMIKWEDNMQERKPGMI